MDRWSRRDLLKIGGSGLFGLSLPQLLKGEAATGRRETSCLFIVLSGGLSHIDTLDPCPEATAETRGPYRPISTATPGTIVTEMCPQLATRTDKFALIRSLSHGDVVHVSAAHTMLSGQPDGLRSNDSPFISSLVSKFKPSTANVPSHVWLHNMKTGTNKIPRYNSGLGRIGFEHAPLRIGYELDNPSQSDFRVKVFDPPAEVSADRLDGRFRLLESIGGGVASGDAANWTRYHERARDLISGPRARQAFDLSHESDRLRDRYGRNPLGQYSLMARRLVEAGVRIVTLTGWPGLAPGETEPTVTQVWDMHDSYYGAHENMFGNGPYGMKWSVPRLDRAVSTLLDDLEDRGLLETTLVCVLGEFGRTPKFEGEGRGRGHWASCYTGLFAGAGVRGGAVYGASDKTGGFVTAGRRLSHMDVGATIYDALGIPPETPYGRDGFGFRASTGEPLREIFG